MHVLFVTSEAFPLIKTGGLADVSGALPKAIKNLDSFIGEIKILMPAYTGVLEKLQSTQQVANIQALGHHCQLYIGKMPESDIEVIVIQNSSLYEREGGPYNDLYGNDWPDNALRFGVLSRIASILSTQYSPLNWQPDLIHCNDWQTGLTPLYVKLVDKSDAKTLFSIHNMAYQGNFHPGTINELELPAEHFNINGYEFYNQIS
ncbi:MAG TPA: glycogen/starch synthase, partial [Methylophilaceae bacterium]|nr:glycogen/starch synthase [Methylophilaceae bacterium]